MMSDKDEARYQGIAPCFHSVYLREIRELYVLDHVSL